MNREETPEGLLRFLGTWSDKVLAEDWRSALDGPCGDDLVTGYLRLRRRAPGWSPHRLDRNNHREIPPAALAVLISGPASGDLARCESCAGGFVAARSTARFCSPRCRKAAHRAQTVAA